MGKWPAGPEGLCELGVNPFELPQLRQCVGDLLCQALRLLGAEVQHLLRDAQLQVLARQLEQLCPVLAVPAVLERAPDLRRIETHRSAYLVEPGDQLLDGGRIAARDVPPVRVARSE